MYRLLIVFFFLVKPAFATKPSCALTDTIPCDPSVTMQRTYCPSCQAWTDLYAPDFTGKLPVEFHLSIFNKNNAELFSTDDIDKGWDGKGKDNLEQTQIFTWKMNYRYEKGGPLYECSGQLTLIQ